MFLFCAGASDDLSIHSQKISLQVEKTATTGSWTHSFSNSLYDEAKYPAGKGNTTTLQGMYVVIVFTIAVV